MTAKAASSIAYVRTLIHRKNGKRCCLCETCREIRAVVRLAERGAERGARRITESKKEKRNV